MVTTLKPSAQVQSPYIVTERDITEYVPDPRNANKGTERGAGMIESSLQKVGPGRSLVADKNGILEAGNKTAQAAVDVGITKVIEIATHGEYVIVHKRLDHDLADLQGEARQYAFFDNRASEISMDWNAEQVLRDFNDGIKLDAFWGEAELKNLFNEIDGTKEAFYKPPAHDNQEAAALQEKWQVKTGDIYQIASKTQPGKFHRVMCGDSRTDLADLILDAPIHLVMTSPPYCVNKDYEQDMTVEDWEKLLKDVFAAVKPYTALWFVNLANRRHFNDGFEINTFGKMVDIFEALGVKMISMRIWKKNITWLQAHPYWRHTFKPVDEYEFLALFADKIPKYKQRPTDDEMTDWGYRGIWEIGSVGSNRLQSARYPVALPQRAIRLLTDFGENVLDPFSGSGTTIEAGEDVGRIVYAMEKEAADVSVTLEELSTRLEMSVSQVKGTVA